MINEEKIKLAEQNMHISTSEIEQDILDTQNEIETMEREIKAFRLLGDRWSMMKADSRLQTRIPERREFIEKLKAILEVRENPELLVKAA